MKYRGLFLCGLLGAGVGGSLEARAQAEAAAPAATPPPAVLRWNNGETASGEPTEATGSDLTWKTPLFEDPLLLDWRALHRIDRPLPDGVPATDPFQFTLRDGSRLYGDLGAVTADTVAVHSARCGDLVLQRSEVLAARRIQGERLVYAGPLGEAGWTAMPDGQSKPTPTLGNVPTRLTGPGGALVLPFHHRGAFLQLPLPQRMEVEFRVRSKDAPAFQMVLDGDERQRLRLETWGDELVLATADFFQSIRKIDPKEREIALCVCWDQPARRCEVYTPEGQLLTQCTVPEDKSGKGRGVRLRNKGRALSLDALRVYAWDGQPLPATDPGRPRVELDDGRFVVGTVIGADAGTVTVSAADSEPPTSFPLGAVDALVFSGDHPAVDPSGTTLAYADGTFLRGEITGINDDRIRLKTTFTAAPLTASVEVLRCLYTPVSDAKAVAALPSLDRLVVQGTTLHGRLDAATGDEFPRWIPVGGKRPALPSKTLPVEITRFVDPKATPAGMGALFYTRMGDALPGVLHGLDREEVDFDCPLVETKKLSAEEWRAIQFNVAVRGLIQGFNAPGWQITKKAGEKIQPEKDALVLSEGARAIHPAAMLNGEVKFNYDTTNFSFVRLRMFCDGANSARALNYVLYRSGSTIYGGVETTEGEFSERNTTTVSSGPTVVRLVVDEKGVRYYLNNNLVESVPFPLAKRAGAGLIIEPAAMWGNSVQEVAVSKFTATMDPGQSLFQDTNADAKAQALTVPRFRKEDLPRHALMAMNGDLLRGEIEAVTNTQFGFRIGLETLRVPRERVAAVIALQKPSDTPPAPDENSAASKLLDRSLDQQMGYGSANFTTLLGVVKQAVPELKFKLPAQDDSQEIQYFFQTKSVGSILDDLCEQFGLRYRVEKGVVIVEKPSSSGEETMLRKPYWLKAHAFPEDKPAADVLAAKGIPFPGGASARWQEASRCLEVANTAINQDKITDLLNREFGGVTAPPTHWLQLINGGRLALAVEKFTPDSVSGTHPVYGRCTVPLSDVYSIRNTLPDLSAASQVVNGWRLAYAPEPVLPESGGEGSVLLGKDAPTFKLAMLGGGNFDLGEQKGRVVVLDFWATWCGPCIKSLPGLIETMAQFPAEQVKFIGLDQAEAPEQVKRFLETRGWKLAVAMDEGQNVARQYGVDGIPHTVVIGPDGKVAWVRTGAEPDGEAAVAEAVKKLLVASPGTKTASVQTGMADKTARSVAHLQ